MFSLLYPAKKLMDSLSFISKFALITLLVCLPMLWLAVDKIVTLREGLNTIERELWGINTMHNAWYYAQVLATFDNLQLVAAIRESEDVQLRLDEHLSQVVAARESLEQAAGAQVGIDVPREVILEFDDSNSLSQYYNHSSTRLLMLSDWMKRLLGRSLLLQDQESEVFDRVNRFLEEVKPSFILINKAAAFDAYLTAYGFVETSAKPAATMLADELSRSSERQEIYAVALQKASTLYQEQMVDLLLGDSFKFDPQASDRWYEHLQAYKVPINTLDQEAQTLFDDISLLLNKRSDHDRNLLISIVVLLAVIILAVLYFIIGFYVSIKLSLAELMTSSKRFSTGDFSCSVKRTTNDEVGQLSVTFESMRMQISSLIVSVAQHSKGAARLAKNVSQNGVENLESSRIQSHQVAQVLAPMTQLACGVEDISIRTKEASEAIRLMQNESMEGMSRITELLKKGSALTGVVLQSTESIKQVEEETQAISGVLNVINGIAERTNLLALNAAIEAARAGDQGRGFAVVADEVRGLARRVQESTNDIESSISSLTFKVGEAVSKMQQSQVLVEETTQFNYQLNDAFNKINQALSSSSDIVESIEVTASEQEMAAKMVNEAVSEIDFGSKKLFQVAEQTNETCRSVEEVILRLQDELARFRS